MGKQKKNNNLSANSKDDSLKTVFFTVLKKI